MSNPIEDGHRILQELARRTDSMADSLPGPDVLARLACDLVAAQEVDIGGGLVLADVLEASHLVMEAWPDAPQEVGDQVVLLILGEVRRTGVFPSQEWIKAVCDLSRG